MKEGETVNEKANSKICGATGFRLAVVFVVDVYVIRRRVFLPRGYDEGATKGRRGGGEQRTLAEYLTTSRALGRRGGTVRARRRGPPKARRKEAERGPNETRRAHSVFCV